MMSAGSVPSVLSHLLARAGAVPADRAEGRAGGTARRSCPPALTGGESTLTGGAKVDWCTFTFQPSPDELVDRNLFDFATEAMGGIMGESVPGMFGYEKGLRFYALVDGSAVHVGRADWGGALHKGRARFDLSGVGCSRVRSWRDFGDYVSRLFEVKLTRVDLAVDALQGEYTVEDAVNWYQAGEFNAGGRMPRHSLVGDWLEPRYGRTLEVGRRENGKMLRAYEKGRQLGDQGSSWTRFEVEIRNNDRDIPLDIFTRTDEYFCGAYKCLSRILDSAAERIATHQKEGEISIDKLVDCGRASYGRLVTVLRGVLSVDEVIECLARPGVPARLDKATLGGFQLRSSGGFAH